MRIKRGNIYWIEQSKYRPAVGSMQKPGRPGIIVSNDANNACSNTVEIVYLTAKPKGDLPTHCTINSSGKPSIALCEQVTTVSTEQLRDYINCCTAEEMAEIDRCLTASLGLTKPTENGTQAEPTKPAITYETRITSLERDLAEAQVREAMLQKMYDDLLTRAMTK